MRATITSICKCSDPAAAPSLRRGSRPLREALRAAATGAPRLVGTAAAMLAAAWPAGERAPSLVDTRRAPDIDWVARLGAAAIETGAPPKPLYLRAPDAQPQNAAQLARR